MDNEIVNKINNLFIEANELIKLEKYSEALQVLTNAKSFNYPIENLEFLIALCFVYMNNFDEAYLALNNELQSFPNNLKAKELIDVIKTKVSNSNPSPINDEEFNHIFAEIRNYSTLAESQLYNLYCLAKFICIENISGNFIEVSDEVAATVPLLIYVIKKYSQQPRRLFYCDLKNTNQEFEKNAFTVPNQTIQNICQKLGLQDMLPIISEYNNNVLLHIRNWLGMISLFHCSEKAKFSDKETAIKIIFNNLYERFVDKALVQIDNCDDDCMKFLEKFSDKLDIKFSFNEIATNSIWLEKPDNFIANPDVSSELIEEFKIDDPVSAGIVSQMSVNNKRDNKINVATFATYAYGGAGVAAYRLHKGLNEIGVVSTLFCLSKKNNESTVKVLHINNVSVEAGSAEALKYSYQNYVQKIVQSYPNRLAGLEMFSDNYSVSEIASIDEIDSADIVHLHWVAEFLDTEKIVKNFSQKKIVWTLHDMNAFTGGCHYAGECEGYKHSCGACPQLGSIVENDLSRQIFEKKYKAFRQLDITVVTPSRWLAECAKQSSIFRNSSVLCIPYGLQTELFRAYDETSKSKLKTFLNVPQDFKVVLFGAQNIDNNRKGFVYLVEALKKVNPDAKIKLVIFGHLPQDISLNLPFELIQCGVIDSDYNLANVYSMADVFVLPSLEDNLPNTVLESLSCGTPVVGFDVGGIPDMVQHKFNGYLAKLRDIEDLAAGIEWVLYGSDGEYLRRNSREKAMELYQLHTQANAYKRLYESLLNKDIDFSVNKEITVKSEKYIVDSDANMISTCIEGSNYLVSAIVSTYNSERFFRGCIEDLLEQTLYKKGKLEIIIINSGSQENEDAIIKEYISKGYKHIKYLRTEREGLYAAWNRGINIATGKYITNANTDDRHRFDALEIMSDELEAHPSIALVYAEQLYTFVPNDTFATTQAKKKLLWAEYSYQNLRSHCMVGPQPMWRKSLHDKYGMFDETFMSAGDWEFWLRIGRTETFKKIDMILGIYYENLDGLANSNPNSIFESKLIQFRHNITKEEQTKAMLLDC